MASALLPEFIQISTDWLRQKVEHINGASAAGRGEFAPVCRLLADAFKALWHQTQDDLRKGMSGHRLRERCREGVSVSEQVLATINDIAAAQLHLESPPGLPNTVQAGAFSETAQEAAKVRDDFRQLLDRAAALPPAVDPEKLKAAESGPFVLLKDLKAGRGPRGS
jgi:hypothetical protein